ncbi:MAG: CopD family protein [Acidobacteriota bacterium]|nr:CopD family protein [Acidobacteriota bacterium]
MPGETLALTLLASAKLMTDVGIVWLVGVSVFRGLALGAGRRGDLGLERRLVRQAGLALGLLFMASAGRLYAQTYSSFGLDEPVTAALLRLVAEQTRWGERWIWQSAAVVAAAPVVAIAVIGVSWAWWLVAIATVGIVVTSPMTGHALSYSDGAFWPMTLQIVHLAAAGAWLGTLLVLVTEGLRPVISTGTDVVGLVARFSGVALVAAGAVGLTGVLTAWFYVDHLPQLWQTAYGRVLLVKTGLFGLTALTGAYNWKVVRPALGAPAGVARLRRSGAAELAVAVVLLAVTAWLVHLPMPHE